MRRKAALATGLVAIGALAAAGMTPAAADPTPTPTQPSGDTPATSTAEPHKAAGTVKVRLEKPQQAKVHRPELAELKAEAERDGISLSEALDRLIAEHPPEGDSSFPDVWLDDLHVQDLKDYEQIADERGWSFEEAIEKVWWDDHPAFDKIANIAPDDWVGSEISPDKSKVRFHFREEIPPKAIELAGELPVEVEFIGGKGYSEKELKAEQRRAEENLPEGLNWLSSFDIDTGVVTIEVNADAKLRSLDPARLVPRRPSNPAVSVEVKVVDGPGLDKFDGYVRGGGFVTDNRYVCTTGFNVINGDAKAPSTAAHCVKDLADKVTYYQSPHGVSGTVTLTAREAHLGTYGDVGRYTRGGWTPTRTFWWNVGEKAYVDGVASGVYAGQEICSFGWATHRRCTYVRNASVNVSSDGITHIGMVLMEDGVNASGDSGGPWHKSRIAYGTTIGHYGGRSLISPAWKFPSAIGWRVWTR